MWRLKINLIFSFNTKNSLIWSFKLSRTVTKLFKQYWVVWVIMANTLSCKVWYVIVCYRKAVLRWTCLCMYSVSQSGFMFEGWYLRIIKKSFQHYSWLIFNPSFWYAAHIQYRKVELKGTLFVANYIQMFIISYNQCKSDIIH